MTRTGRPRFNAKAFGVAASAILALTTLAACSSSGASNSNSNPNSSATLNWITFDAASTLQPIVNAFEKLHPNIKINIDSFPLNSFTAKVVADMTAKTSSVDIITVDAPEVAEYTTRHYILPLNKYFTTAELKSSISGAVLASSYYDGVLSAPAQSSSNHVLYYNPKIFAAHHITPPSATNPWTWQQVAQAARALTVRNNGTTSVWGLLFEQGTAPYELLPLPESLGANPLNFNSNGWLQAMQFYYNCINTWKITTNPGPPTSTTEADSLFQSGHVAMMAGGEWDAVGWANQHVPFDIAPYPYFADGKIVVPTDGPHLGVAAYSNNVAQAVEFIKYATIGAGPEVQFTQGGELNEPSNIPVLNSINQESKFASFPWNVYRLTGKQIPYTVPRPVTPFFDAYATLTEQMFGDIATGTNPASALQSAEKEWQSTTAAGS